MSPESGEAKHGGLGSSGYVGMGGSVMMNGLLYHSLYGDYVGGVVPKSCKRSDKGEVHRKSMCKESNHASEGAKGIPTMAMEERRRIGKSYWEATSSRDLAT